MMSGSEPQSERTQICLDCRTALPDEQACDGGKAHRLAKLQLPRERELLLREVWGPPDLRQRIRNTSIAGGAGAVAGSAVEGWEFGCHAVDCIAGEFHPAILIVTLAGALIAMVGYFLVAWITHMVRQFRNRPAPQGARRQPLRPHGSRPRGKVVEGEAMVPPWGGEPLMAGAVELRSKRFIGSGVMLRDGFSAGLAVELDDGRRVELPAGRLRVAGAPGTRKSSSSKQRLKPYLQALDPYRELEGDLDPFPFDEVITVEVRKGDRVELVGQLRAAPVASSPAEAVYRQAASSVLVPEGRILLRRLRDAR